ncbi:MAG TPA: protoporphyrinogen oxidase HemJ [Gemmatimonadales bacterium]|jgi:putative membrane protein|nr:protoporphyrinogen oxidase HemJ [Gemmatimonadales bacterium]
MLYLWLKTLHIIAVVSWFAGLFYHGRLLVYHAEALVLTEPQRGILARQYSIMESRLFRIIMSPAMVLTLATGGGMLLTSVGGGYVAQPWMLAKLVVVGLLVGFHFYLRRIMLELAAGQVRWSGRGLRLLNEVPTLLLVSVTFLAVFKTATPWAGVGAALVLLVMAILVGARAYDRRRRKAGEAVGTLPALP